MTPSRRRCGSARSTGILDQAWFCPGLPTPDGRPAFTLGFRGGLIVDGSGRRFANESLPYDRLGRRMADARGPFHLVFDARSGSGGPVPGLYAAGNTSASFTGPVYPGPGIPIRSAMAFAYRAVQEIRSDHA